jgi:hypothetical protein
MALRAIADERERVVLEVVLELCERPVATLVDNFLRAGKVKGLDTTGLFETRSLVSELHSQACWHILDT